MAVKTPLCNYSGTIKELQSGDSVSIGYTAENVANKATDFSTINNTLYGSLQAVETRIQYYISGVNPAVAVQAATTQASNTSGLTYNNGASGIGATLTGTANTAITWDGYTFTAIGQRGLVKNDTQSPSGAYNGVYYVTQIQTALLPPILTRALDYDMPSDINNTGAIPVVNGTVNALTSWLLTSSVTTVGTDPLTYTQFSANPSNYVPYTGATSDLNLGAHNYKGTGGLFLNVTTPEGTAFDIRDAANAGTTLGYSAFGQYVVTNSGSLDIETRNMSTGAGATNDYTQVMDDVSHYGGMGMASKNYVVSGSSAIGGYDQYLYSFADNIEIIAYGTGKHIDLVTGGGNTANIRARASDAGFHIYGATAYMPLVGPTAANGAVQSMVTGTAGYDINYVSSSAKPIWVLGTRIGAVQSIGNTSATTPSDAAGTATNIVINNSGAQANTIISGASALFTATAATRPSIQCSASGTIQINAHTWWNGAATSPYYYLALFVNGVVKARIDFINNASYDTCVSIGWTGTYTGGTEIKLMLGQTNGTARATTCTDYTINAVFLGHNE